MKCDICGAKIETTFLNKPIGTYVKDAKGKKKMACPACQTSGKDKEIRQK